MDNDEGGKLAKPYLLLDMRDLGNMIDGVKRAKHGEGPSGTNLTEDTLSWYISQNPKKWANWVSMASDFMDRFRFNTENAPDVFYIQNLKKKPTETFREYATRWRLEAAKVRPALEEEQLNKFFVRAQDPQYYERLMVIENYKFSDIIKLGKE
ncbi:uncharacterized protein [Nicotiana tomentosiformis]|uniref:uncharacterized protein n=1 Tax=Nicotiana tomentosiformis TaxID=4098 RepID=UPI00388C6906